MLKRAEVQQVQTRQVADKTEDNPFGPEGLNETFSNLSALIDGPAATGTRMSMMEMLGGGARVLPAPSSCATTSSSSGCGGVGDDIFGFGFVSTAPGLPAAGGQDRAAPFIEPLVRHFEGQIRPILSCFPTCIGFRFFSPFDVVLSAYFGSRC